MTNAQIAAAARRRRRAVVLVSIAVTPPSPTITGADTQQMVATGTYSDASTAILTGLVTWSSATPAAATVSAGGLVTGVAAGSSVITATLGAVSGNTTATVAFSPIFLAPALWFEADTLVATSGSNVVGVGNLGSIGAPCDAAQSTGGNQPTVSATGGPGGTRPAIIHTSPRYLLVPHNTGYKTTQLTWWAVLKLDAVNVYQTDSSTSTNSATWGDGFAISKTNATALNTDMSLWASGYLTNLVTFTALGTTGWCILIGRYDGTAVKGRRSGVAGTDDPFVGPIAHGTGPMVIGAAIASAAPTYAYNGELRWVSRGVIPRALANGECAQLEAWVTSKWSVS